MEDESDASPIRSGWEHLWVYPRPVVQAWHILTYHAAVGNRPREREQLAGDLQNEADWAAFYGEWDAPSLTGLAHKARHWTFSGEGYSLRKTTIRHRRPAPPSGQPRSQQEAEGFLAPASTNVRGEWAAPDRGKEDAPRSVGAPPLLSHT